jgi:hypothetical protein
VTSEINNDDCYERPEPVTAKRARAPWQATRCRVQLPSENPWYKAPDYGDIEALDDEQVAERMESLKFQIRILEEAAEFELGEPERNLILLAISKYKIEVDTLGKELCRRIVRGDLREVTERTQHRNGSTTAGPNTKQAKPGLAVVRGAMKKDESVQEMSGLTLTWDGSERRCGTSSLLRISTSSGHKKQRPRVIEISFEY